MSSPIILFCFSYPWLKFLSFSVPFFCCFSSKRINNLYSIFKRDQICIEIIIRFRSRKDFYVFRTCTYFEPFSREEAGELSENTALGTLSVRSRTRDLYATEHHRYAFKVK